MLGSSLRGFWPIIALMGNSPSVHGAERSTLRPDRPDPYLRLQCVTIYVRDQDRSLRFYVDQLGFNRVGDVRFKSDFRWVAVAPPDGSAMLALVAPKPDSKEYKLIGRPTQVVFVTEDVVARFREWRRRGVRFQSTPRLRRMQYKAPDPSTPPGEEAPVWGGVFARFQDVDGNSFQLVGFDEVSREIEAQRRAAAEKLEAERRAAQELEIAKPSSISTNRRTRAAFIPCFLTSATARAGTSIGKRLNRSICECRRIATRLCVRGSRRFGRCGRIAAPPQRH